MVYTTATSTITASTTLRGQDVYTTVYATVGLTSTYTYTVYSTTRFIFTSASTTVSADTLTLYPSRTTTSTVSQATATVYAACATNNIINTVNGTGINGASENLLGDAITVNTAADCCAVCQTTAYCSGSIFIPLNQPNCNLIGVTNVCAASNVAGNFTIGIPGGGFFISGAVCGRWAIQPQLGQPS